MKEERQYMNKVEEEYQDQNDHDVNEEKSVSDSNQTTDVKKPFSCSQCGNSFTRKTSLKDHMLIHTGEKPFSCSQCGKSFTLKGQLKRHLVSHTSKKAFQLL